MKQLTRTIELDTRAADDKARTVPAVLSTETPVTQYGIHQILRHTRDAVDLSRAPLPLLTGHDAKNPNIGIIENLRVDGGKLRGLVRLGQSKEADNLWPDIQAGIVRGLSVGFAVIESETGDTPDTEIVTKWLPFEASVIGVGADENAGFNRNHQGDTAMAEETDTGNDNVVAHTRWLKQEAARRADIRQVFNRFAGDYSDLLDTCLDDPNIKAERASQMLLNALGNETGETLGGDFRQSSNGGNLSHRDLQDVGANRYGNYTARDTLGEFTDAATDGLLQRGGIKIEKPHPGAVDVRNMRLSDVAETILRQFGVRTSGFSRDQVIRKALSTRGLISHSSSDFPNLLENIASKSLLAGFNETPAIYRSIARIGNLPDFKQASRTALSDFSDLEVVYENGEYKYGSFSDLKETLKLQTFGKLFSISRQALVNDDLSAFTQIPRGLAAAGVRVLDDMVVSVLVDNAALNQDSTALFHADHSNLETSGGAPSVSALDAGFVAMASQTGPGPDGAILDVKPSLLIVPAALDATARTLVQAINDPAGTTLAEPNPFRGRLEVVSTARLDVDSTVKWYLSADPNVFDTVEIAFLDGQTSPYLETKDGWNVDGVEYKVRLDAVAGAMDFRGLYQNDGN